MFSKIKKTLGIKEKQYWVFRRYAQVDSFSNAEGAIIQEQFALHFVEPFTSKKKAEAEIKEVLIMQPWQKFIVLS